MSAPVKMNRRQRKAVRTVATMTAEAPAGRMLSMVAAATAVRTTTQIPTVMWGGTDWQKEGWLHYDNCPEFWRGVEIGASNLSRARLIGVEVDPMTGEPGVQPTDNPDVNDIMAQLFGGPTGQGQALAVLYRQLEVAGDSWTLATDDPDMDRAQWEVLATTEVTSGGSGRIMVEQIDGTQRQVDPQYELLMRIWQPHPKRRGEANSATRSLLPVLRELAALSAMVSATVKSRLASAGILWIPQEIQLPKATTQVNDVTQIKSESSGAAGWLDLLTEAMVAPIQDPDSASAVVPLVVTAPGDSIVKVLHQEFGRDLDATIEPLREACIKRLAVGMNLPPAILMGLGDVNHWTAWAITEDYAKAYLAPKLQLIADAVTNFYLRPALRARGLDPRTFAVYFDLDKLVPRQISVDNAQAAYDTGLLAEDDYLEALGFSSSQKATNQERARTLLITMLRHSNPQTLMELAATINAAFPDIIIQPLSPTGTLGPGIDSDDAAPVPPATPAARPAIQAPPVQKPPPTGVPPNAGGA